MKLDKYILLTWLIFILLVGIGFFLYCSFLYSPQHTQKEEVLTENEELLHKKVIVIDPGHGGYDPGTFGNDLYEKNINLDVASALQKTLEKEGTTVYLTRSDDHNPTLTDRARFSSQKKADVFISLHINATKDTRANGISTYYSRHLYKKEANPFPEESKELAETIASNVSHTLEMDNHGAFDQGFVVLRQNKAPSILVELGFITNKQDSNKMKDSYFASDAAEGIKRGLLEYFKKNDGRI